MNALYDVARERFLTKQWDWLADTIVPIIVSSDYVFGAAHGLSDITPAMRLATGPALTGKTAARGVAFSAPILFSRVAGAPVANALVFFRSDTSELLWYGGTGFGFPFTPNGSDVFVQPDALLGGWFQL